MFLNTTPLENTQETFTVKFVS